MGRNFSPYVLLVLLAALLVGTAPAQAHDTLISVSPEDGAHVESPPAEVVLTFSGAPLDVAPQAVLQKDGEIIETEPVTLDGFDAILPLPKLEAGDYTVVYSIVSSDGHRIDGTTSFSVAAGTGEGSGTPPDATAASGETPSPTDDAAQQGSDTAEEPDDGIVSGIRWAGILIVTLGIAVIISRSLRSR